MFYTTLPPKQVAELVGYAFFRKVEEALQKANKYSKEATSDDLTFWVAQTWRGGNWLHRDRETALNTREVICNLFDVLGDLCHLMLLACGRTVHSQLEAMAIAMNRYIQWNYAASQPIPAKTALDRDAIEKKRNPTSYSV